MPCATEGGAVGPWALYEDSCEHLLVGGEEAAAQGASDGWGRVGSAAEEASHRTDSVGLAVRLAQRCENRLHDRNTALFRGVRMRRYREHSSHGVDRKHHRASAELISHIRDVERGNLGDFHVTRCPIT